MVAVPAATENPVNDAKAQANAIAVPALADVGRAGAEAGYDF